MKRVLVANRGEIALRVVRACRAEGLESVAIHSAADRDSAHVQAADRAVCVGPAPAAESYLRPEAILHVALASGCDAVHPGYGFLAERADFARMCRDAGVVFVGPSTAAIACMGDKDEARRAARRLGVPIVPGSDGVYTDARRAVSAASAVGFPVLIKARAGGGGRGMRLAADRESFAAAFQEAMREAETAFGDGALYLERYVERARHVEVQVFGDEHGTVRHLWERDCTIQRRYQKLVEESPSPALDEDTRGALCRAAVRLAVGIGYVNAGTVEFICDSARKEFYFIEMNTRIQVEHPVTEMLTGLDLVREQLRVAAGRPLSFAAGVPRPAAHAIEFRINAEDSTRGFRPSPGRITDWRPPVGDGVRLDSHVSQGYSVPPYYDSLLAKLIVRGGSRGEAIDKARLAFSEFHVQGIPTTIPFHQWLLSHPEFLSARVHTRWAESALLSDQRAP